jgi:hypothetical protein
MLRRKGGLWGTRVAYDRGIRRRVMYYVLVKGKAVGPFADRNAAYSWAGQRYNVGQYAVKTDRVVQQEYLHLPIERPDA